MEQLSYRLGYLDGFAGRDPKPAEMAGVTGRSFRRPHFEDYERGYHDGQYHRESGRSRKKALVDVPTELRTRWWHGSIGLLSRQYQLPRNGKIVMGIFTFGAILGLALVDTELFVYLAKIVALLTALLVVAFVWVYRLTNSRYRHQYTDPMASGDGDS